MKLPRSFKTTPSPLLFSEGNLVNTLHKAISLSILLTTISIIPKWAYSAQFPLSGNPTAATGVAKEVFYFVKLGTTLSSQVAVFDVTNPALIAIQSRLQEYAVEDARAILAEGGTLADAQIGFLQSMNDTFALYVKNSDIYDSGLIRTTDAIGPGGSGYISDVADIINSSTGVACLETTAMAQTAIEQVGAEFSIESVPMQMHVSDEAYQLITGAESATGGWHAGLLIQSTDNAGIPLQLYNTTVPSVSNAMLMPKDTPGILWAGQSRVAYMDASGQPVDAAGNLIATTPGSIGEQIESAADTVESIISANNPITSTSGPTTVLPSLDFSTPAGPVSESDAGTALVSKIGVNSIEYAAEEAEPSLFRYVWGGVSDLSESAGELAIPLMIGQMYGVVVAQVNNDLAGNGLKFTSYADTAAICNLMPSCASSSFGVQIATAVGLLSVQPIISEIAGTSPNMLCNPDTLTLCNSPTMVQFNTFTPTGFAPCVSSALTCWGENGGMSVSKMADGSYIESDRFGITETYTPTGTVIPYDFMDGNGPGNYPLYRLTLNTGNGSLSDGYVSVALGHIYEGGLTTYLSSLNGAQINANGGVPQTIDVRANDLPLDTIADDFDEMLSSVDQPTYEQTVGALPTFSPNTVTQELGVDPTLSSSPILTTTTAEGSLDNTPTAGPVTTTCSDNGACSNSLGQSWVLSDPTYYASNGGTFSYTPSGALCAINYVSGCYNNNPLGGFGGAQSPGGLTGSGPGGPSQGGFYNPCGIDGEFDPSCWNW